MWGLIVIVGLCVTGLVVREWVRTKVEEMVAAHRFEKHYQEYLREEDRGRLGSRY